MRRRLIISVGAGAAVIVLFVIFLLKPVSASISDTRSQIRDARSEQASLRLQIKALEEARREAPAIQARLATFDLLLPKTSDLPVFIRQVQAAANQSGMDLTSIAPSPPTALQAGPGVDAALTGRGVFTLNVVLQVTGGFFRLEAFLRRLEGLQRVAIVNSISITPGTDENDLNTLNTTVTMQMFVVNPNAVVPGQTVPPGGGGAGGPATPSPTPTSG